MSNHDRKGPPSPGEGLAEDTALDTALKSAWQQASNEQPPSELDAAIIAAARKSVQDRGAAVSAIRASPKSRHRWMQWQPLAAAATVAGLAFILVQLMPRDRDVTPSIRMEERASGPAAAEKQNMTAPVAAVPQAAATSGATTSADTAARAMVEQGMGASVPTAPAPRAKVEAPDHEAAGARASGPPVTTEIPAPAAATPGATAAHSMEADQRGAVAQEVAGSAAPGVAAAAARETSSDRAAPLRAEDRAARIAALYASGDTTGAADALRAFRAADPHADTYLPDSLRDWARTIH